MPRPFSSILVLAALAGAGPAMAGCSSTPAADDTPAADQTSAADQISAEDTAGVRLMLAATSAAPADTITITLDNTSSATVGYNLCTSSLERRTGDEWQPVPSDRVCTMELRMLEPGEQAGFPLPLPPDLTPGEYRVVTGLHPTDADERVDVASTPFTVGQRGGL